MLITFRYQKQDLIIFECPKQEFKSNEFATAKKHYDKKVRDESSYKQKKSFKVLSIIKIIREDPRYTYLEYLNSREGIQSNK